MDTPPNSRRDRYKINDVDSESNMNQRKREPSSIPKASSGIGDRLMQFAHGEDDSNLDPEKEQSHYHSVHAANQNEELSDSDNKVIEFRKVKDHGLVWPWHPQQIGTWVAMTILVLTFYLFLVPGTYYIHVSYVIAVWVVYAILLMGVICYCLKATLTDPTDRNVVYERQCRKDGIEAEINDELEFFCDVWEAFVHERTKHWGDCNRWVDLFDHHWKWLNNWVGGKNYSFFLILITVLLFQTLVFMGVSITFIISAFTDEDGFQEGFQKWYDSDLNRYGLVVYVGFLQLVWALIVYFTSSLIVLHIKLYKWGVTAYEFIVYKEDKKERLENLEAGIITQKEFDEQERQALEDIRKKK